MGEEGSDLRRTVPDHHRLEQGRARDTGEQPAAALVADAEPTGDVVENEQHGTKGRAA